MRGKAGIVLGLAAGYVLGSRAGRERYEQIKTQWLKVYNLDPVQKQVGKAKELGKTAALALPTALWNAGVKVTKAAAGTKGGAGDRFDAATQAGKESADDIARAWDTTNAEVKADAKADEASTPAPGAGGS